MGSNSGRSVPWLLLALAVLAVPAAGARTLRIRTPSRSLSLQCAAPLPTYNFSFTEGEWYETARAALADPANFGVGGVVGDSIVHGPSFDSMNPEDLDGADILVLNPVNVPINWIGLRVFGTYARGGVGFISFQNGALTFFADAGGCVGDNLATISAAGATSPVMNGPFGTVTDYVTGWNCSFITIDADAVLLATNDSGGPNAIALDLGPRYPGAARAVSYSDEEQFASLSVSGCGIGPLARGNNSERLLLNTFAWVAATARDPIPDEVEGAGDLDGDGRPDHLDGDNDNDGILDLYEVTDTDPATPPDDTDGDTSPDFNDRDSDGDGLDDVLETGGEVLDPPPDTDADTIPDVRDDDSDGDGYDDAEEGLVDTDLDGVNDWRDTDSDGDGVPDAADVCRTVADADQRDTDGDTVGDACEPAADADADADGDGDATDSGADGDTSEDAPPSDAPGACDPAGCMSSCRAAGHPGGSCEAGLCACDAAPDGGSDVAGDGGTAPADGSGGCGCRTAAGAGRGLLLALFVLVALLGRGLRKEVSR